MTQIISSLLQNSDLNLKKVGKITRPFRYNLNQIPYDSTMELKDRFKGLNLIDRVPEEIRMEFCNTVQEAVTKNHPSEKEMSEGKMVV